MHIVTPSHPFRQCLFGKSRPRGIALVIVLGMLALIAILVMAFFSSVKTELQSSKSYASEGDARTLADTAVNLVISQIQDATTSGTSYPLAWASQPGMIRTYDNTGKAVMAYKLYSSDTLRVKGSYDALGNLSSEIPDSWADADSTNLFVDINKPAYVMRGITPKVCYPIIDPRAVGASFGNQSTSLSGTNIPIEGCFLNTTTGITATTARQQNPIPMPVRWLYVLKDGSIASINQSTKAISGVGTILPDGTKNTVVGRIAFWTDDETCKVNINTSSEGTFWDRPWTVNATGTSMVNGSDSYDLSLAVSMPVQNEFQRYPGHPAMTCLSTIFPSLGGSVPNNETIYSIIPRVVGGGSKGGTITITGSSFAIIPDTDRLFASVDELVFSATSVMSGTRQSNPTNAGIFTQDDIDKARFFLTTSSRAPEVNIFNKPRITLWPLQANTGNVSDPINARDRNSKDKLIAFCSTIGKTPYYFQRYNSFYSYATGSSNSPSSQSSIDDWNLIPRNQELYTYLRHLTADPIPGLGGSLADKYPNTRDQILTEIFDFIRSSVNTINTGEPSVPYYYAPFDPKGFTTGQSQVVPIVLPKGTTLPDGNSLSATTKGFGRFSTIVQAALIFYNKDKLAISGTVPPNGMIKTGTYNGTTFTSGTILNNYVIPNFPDWSTFPRQFGGAGNASILLTGTNYTLSSETAPLQNIGAVLILQPFNVSPGPPPWTSHVRYVVNGLDSLQANGSGIGFANQCVNMVSSIDSMINCTALTGLEPALQQPPRMPKILGMTNPNNPDAQYYPLYGSFQVSGSTFNFSGGDISIQIYNGGGAALAASTPIQTIHMSFPRHTNLPVPSLGIRSIASGTTRIDLSNRYCNQFTDFNNRLNYLVTSSTGSRYGLAEFNAQQPLPLIVTANKAPFVGDIVRSVEARYGGVAHGDYRLLAGLTDVPSDFFEGHGSKDTPSSDGLLYSGTDRLIHGLCVDGMADSSGNILDTSAQNGYYAGTGAANDKRGKLIPSSTGVEYPNSYRWDNLRRQKAPVVPRGLNGAYQSDGITLGDWDNGIGWLVDGPFINIPDQCDSNSPTRNGNLPLYYSSGGIVDGAGIVESGASFSPNRQIASAVAFGSLPTGIDPSDSNSSGSLKSKPWQTLLFCKNPLGGATHPGFGTPIGASGPPYRLPPDHAFLDFFTMPIVEPYAISEPFSTAGKVNMNYQLVPFTYLTRDTAVRATLKATNITAIPTSSGSTYKLVSTNGQNRDYRYTLNLNEADGTLEGFERRFNPAKFGVGNSPDIFRSASEICDIYLVPKTLVNTTTGAPGNPTYSTMDSWWSPTDMTKGYRLTGDNVREQPYGHIYPRLTTKTNTFTVHVIAQTLKKTVNTEADIFVSGRDQITAEFRGSFVVERYVAPDSDTLVHLDGKTPANENDSDAMVGPYKFRIINSKRFAP